MSDMGKINWQDVGRAAMVALLAGGVAPLWGAVSAQGFSLFTADWPAIGKAVADHAFVGGMGYMVKNFLSDSNGKFLGVI